MNKARNYFFFRGVDFNSFSMKYQVTAYCLDDAKNKVIEHWVKSSKREGLETYPLPKFTHYKTEPIDA